MLRFKGQEEADGAKGKGKNGRDGHVGRILRGKVQHCAITAYHDGHVHILFQMGLIVLDELYLWMYASKIRGYSLEKVC